MTETQPPLDTRKLEVWLRQLEAALGDVSVVDRSDIVMEMNAHIRDSYERGGRTLDEILNSLGEPAQVANRYRLERGMQPVVIPKGQTTAGAFFKWATIGLLGFFAISAVGGIILISNFFPLVKVDENEKRVKILGGMIEINDSELAADIGKDLDGNIQLKVGGFESGASQTLEAEVPGPVTSVAFSASNGELEVEGHSAPNVTYKCRVNGGLERKDVQSSGPSQDFALDFTDFAHADCKIRVPAQTAIKVSISNGDVKLKNMRNPTTVKLDNGRIVFKKHPEAFYTLKTLVTNGVVLGLADFESEQRPNAKKEGELFSADLQVTNGGIRLQ